MQENHAFLQDNCAETINNRQLVMDVFASYIEAQERVLFLIPPFVTGRGGFVRVNCTKVACVCSVAAAFPSKPLLGRLGSRFCSTVLYCVSAPDFPLPRARVGPVAGRADPDNEKTELGDEFRFTNASIFLKIRTDGVRLFRPSGDPSGRVGPARRTAGRCHSRPHSSIRACRSDAGCRRTEPYSSVRSRC